MKTSSFTGSVFPRPILLICAMFMPAGGFGQEYKTAITPPPYSPLSSPPPPPAGIWLIYIVVPRYVRMYCLHQCTRLWNREKRTCRAKYKDVREGTKDVRQGREKGTEDVWQGREKGTKDIRQGREKGTEEWVKWRREEKLWKCTWCVEMIFSYAQLVSNQFSRMLSQRVTNFHACSAHE
jgi:hypothetical protein